MTVQSIHVHERVPQASRAGIPRAIGPTAIEACLPRSKAPVDAHEPQRWIAPLMLTNPVADRDHATHPGIPAAQFSTHYDQISRGTYGCNVVILVGPRK